MIDLHCHILPGVDDGAATMDEALKMAHMAASSGVKCVVATPHCNLPWAESEILSKEDLARKIQRLQKALEETGIPLRVLPGAEVFCTTEFPELLHRQALPTLADSRYLLLEFYPDESPDFMDNCFEYAVHQGKIPVIAHPERYEAVQRLPQLGSRWFHKGYIIQVNKGSLLGRFGRKVQSTADRLLQQGLIHVVASDAHAHQVRTPHMEQIFQKLQETCGPVYTRILLDGNPGRIVRDQAVIQP